MKTYTWILKPYQELSKEMLFDFYYLRQEVFVVEQNCPYQDCDFKDKDSFHLLAYDNELLVAYLRIVKPGVSYQEPAIGRVVTKKKYRGIGLGKELMKKGIVECLNTFDSKSIRISAQEYLIPFYQSLGFKTVGEGYLEDDIPHIEMVYTKS